MLTSCFGLSLRTGTSVVSIVNSIASIFYILYYICEYNSGYGYAKTDLDDNQWSYSTTKLHGIFMNYITLIFLLIGFTSLYASLSLKQATLKNEIHKIYLWLLIGYVQLGTIITIETTVLFKYTITIRETVGLLGCSVLINAAMVYQLLIVQSFYAEEKLVQENNYTRLCSELASQVQEQTDEFQSVDL